jgi:hypothetical protein
MRLGHILLTTFYRRPNIAGAPGNAAWLTEDWLHDQWRLFSEFTVPSIAAQSECDFTWVVICRPDSPEWFRALTDTVRIGPVVHFSFSPNDPFLGTLVDESADALLVTRTRPAGALHRRAMERIREDCEADPYTSAAVTLTDGYLLDRAARRIRPYHSLRAPLCTTISLESARGDLSRGGRRGRAPCGLPDRSISEGEPMFAMLAPEKRHPGRGGRPLDGRWLAARATADILDRDFGLALTGEAGRGPAWPGHGLRARPAVRPRWLPPPATARRQKVVVSIPCFRAWSTLARAVESVLDQTHGDLLLIVANDGDDHPRWDVLDHVRDPRLVRVDYQASRGRYFADQIALMARLGQYLLVHGADEWSEPDRVQALLQEIRGTHGIAAVSACYQHQGGGAGPSAVVGPVLPPVPITPLYPGGPGRAGRLAYQALFDAPGLLNVGGCYGGHRLEYDNFLLHVLRMTGAVIPLDRPLYHQAGRHAAPQPDEPAYVDPQARASAAAACTRLYVEAYHLYCEYLQGSVGYPVLCRQLRSLAWRHVSASDWDLLRAEASRLRWLVATGPDREHRADQAARRPARALAGTQRGARLLAAHTVPAGSMSAGSLSAGPVLLDATRPGPQPGLPVIAGILTARGQADLRPDAIIHPLLPHDATVMLERTGADFVLIEAAAILPGSAWAYAANPAAADRGRRLADLVDAAHAEGKPVVFLRNLPRHRIPGLGWLDAMCDAVVPGGLGVQLARFNPVDPPARRPSGPLYMAARHPREPAGQRRLLDQLTGGKRPAVRVADVPWRELPDWYRRHAIFLAASAGQASEQRACGARVIAPLGLDGAADTLAAVDAAAVIAQLDAARAAGVPPMTEVRQVLREIFEADATPVRLATIAGLAGLHADVLQSRQIAVLTTVRDAAEAEMAAHQLLRQRLRPAEVVVACGPAEPTAVAQGVADEIGRALTGLVDAGIAVRIACGESEREAARRIRLPSIARWDCRAGRSEWYLLDLVCARECSRADVIGRSADADYVFADTAEPALVRADLLGPGGPPLQSWSRRGIRMLSITC